jgi:alpha-glucuronidase
MKKLNLLVIAFFFLVGAQAQQFTLVKKGNSKCRIIIPEKANVTEIQAAMVFQDYIQRISGASIPIGTDIIAPEDNEVLIGNVNRAALQEVPLEELGTDGFVIQNTDKSLLIAGGTEKGVLYGVYTFLEKYLGCRKYSSAVTYVPKQKTVVLNSIHDRQVPAFTYRENYYRDALDPEYQDWHKHRVVDAADVLVGTGPIVATPLVGDVDHSAGIDDVVGRVQHT